RRARRTASLRTQGTARSRACRSPVRCRAVFLLCKECSRLRLLRFELRAEIPWRAGDAVFVRSAVRDRFGEEVTVAGRRRRQPLECRRLPGILVDERAPLDAHEEVHDEEQLKEPEPPRRVALNNIPVE